MHIDIDFKFIISSLITVLGLGATYWKIYIDNKKNKKDINSFIKERISGLEDKFNRFAMDFNDFKSDNNFKQRFKNAISEQASTILTSSHSLDEYEEYNMVLMDWVSYMQDFGLKYWYSNYRYCHSKKDTSKLLSEYIELDMTSALKSFENSLKLHIKGERCINHANKRMCFIFADFIKTQKCYTFSELLLIELNKNGFDADNGHDRFIATFERYTHDFIHSFIDAVISWRKLPDYDSVIEKELNM